MINSSQSKRIEYSPHFVKLLANAPSTIKVAFYHTLELFMQNHHHPALRNHLLTGKYQDFRSIDVTEDWRALYREERERIMFAHLGAHEELYGKR